MSSERFPHIVLDERFRKREAYKAHRQVVRANLIPQRPRDAHANRLKHCLLAAWQSAADRQAVSHSTREGVYLEFRSDAGAVLVTKSLDDMRSQKVRLLNVRTENDQAGRPITYATVYVSNDKRRQFLDKIERFQHDDTEKGHPQNADLINSIADIRDALMVESFWTDQTARLPATEADFVEVWLRGDTDEVESGFRSLCEEFDIPVEEGSIKFPERRVLVIQANRADLEKLSMFSDSIAEYRKAKETSAYWLTMENVEQMPWVQELVNRLKIKPDTNTAVCILDTGVNWGHPLLSPALSESDCQAYDLSWGKADHDGHGTLMAGVVAFGDLREALASSGPVTLTHHLESVKVLPPGRAENPKGLWGHVTAQSVSIAEIQAPERKRIICLAVTATDTRDRGRPSSWSGAIDKASSGMDDDIQRLFVISAGNLGEPEDWINYPDSQILESVHDPAQSWNALTVGAYTSLARITDTSLTGFKTVAPADGLSPFSSTSATWEDMWPLKPDIVLEGGNLAVDATGFADESDDLSVLSTNNDFTRQMLTGFNMTSAAAAQAACWCGKLQAAYPNFWPETIRALMVHSANWTDTMKRQFLPAGNRASKADYKRMVRLCGWGVPDIDRALNTARNHLTMISEAVIQPFKMHESRVVTNDMHLHELPWPKDILLHLPAETEISMRVTLSYFIQPGPGEIGWKDRYRYPSHQLRFSVKLPGESLAAFHSRISAAAESDEEDTDNSTDSRYWTVGQNSRHKGSIHSDYWKGSAADLATSGVLAVYPKTGWWKERKHLGMAETCCRYSLVVSISTPSETIDIYTPVAQQVGVPIITKAS
jgi:hypothetical protein